MAESILPIAEMLTKLLIKEAAFLKKVKKEVEFLVKKLKDIGSDLRKADVMTNREEEFDEWVSQLRDLAFKAEDVIEVFVNNATPYDGCDVFQLIMGCFSQIITLYKLESEINDINIKLNNLPERGSLLTIWSPEDGETSIRHQDHEDLASSRRDEDDDMVGFEKEAKELAFSLKKEEPQGKLVVISIWGQAGAGKTALARNIYKRSDVSSQFDCVAWVSVSPEYEVKDIWQAILKQVKKLTEEEKEQFQKVEDPHGLLDKVHNYLKGKNYLIVLDDLWKQKDWEIISKAFPKSPQKKCRVLLTTRIEEVARVANPSTDPETLRVLDKDESLKLFLKKVFGGSLEDSLSTLSKEMENVARLMLAKYCEGLPIAIVLLGGILSAKRKDIFEWTEMLRKFHSDLIESRVLRKVFSLSYNELPYLSKPCFLYFGLFPEDSVIECDKLIRLWVAEGFLEQRDNEAMEDVGRECLKGLIQRSMVRVVDRKSNGDPQTCRTHDLVRSFIIQEAKKAKFSNISKKKQLISVVESSRRIALHPEDIDFFHIGTSSAPSESTSVNLSHPLFSLLPSRMRPSFVEGNHDPVGIEDDADQLASCLIKGKPLGKLEVVSIIGTAGLVRQPSHAKFTIEVMLNLIFLAVHG
ncbi:putative disease resistance RPP13-like protein 3 [Macadamia integrifolia]|uniref:putative disease resistance RPP13-like protein 3 n=1 Tax=Macadamia integrifolia TaxID=60698 RepID=UPI001C4F9A27|nr:putative disease resistance RPP13-like protein 3 [Macadamia integrifolia]